MYWCYNGDFSCNQRDLDYSDQVLFQYTTSRLSTLWTLNVSHNDPLQILLT